MCKPDQCTMGPQNDGFWKAVTTRFVFFYFGADSGHSMHWTVFVWGEAGDLYLVGGGYWMSVYLWGIPHSDSGSPCLLCRLIMFQVRVVTHTQSYIPKHISHEFFWISLLFSQKRTDDLMCFFQICCFGSTCAVDVKQRPQRSSLPSKGGLEIPSWK